MEEANRKRPTDADQQLVSPSKRSRFSTPVEPRSSSKIPPPSVDSNDANNNNNDASNGINNGNAQIPRNDPFDEETSSDAETSSDDGASSNSSSSLSENFNSSDAEEGNDNNEQNFRSHPESSEASIPYVRGRAKPRIHRINQESDILSRVSSFLPKLKDANEDLQRDIAAGRTKDIALDEVNEDEGGQYVEMNLGLGVLEEKRDGSNDGSGSKYTEASDLEDEDEDEDEDDQDPTTSTSTSTQPQKSEKEANVLGKLMGDSKTANTDKPAIEEIND